MDACKYHPAQAASWHCPRCQIDLCMNCVVQDTRSALPKCSVCRSDLHSLGISQVVTPFWQRLPAFFAYGFQASVLKFIGLVALFCVLGVFLPFLYIVLGVGVSRFLFAYAERTARGEMEAPALGEILGDGGLSIFFKQLGFPLLMALLVMVVGHSLGPRAALLTYAFAVIGYPASTMLLAATRSFSEAVSPVAIIGVIRGIGWPYALMYAFLTLLSLSSYFVLAFAFKVLPLFLSPLVGIGIMLYFAVVSFHLMGYVLYQYHHELGLPVSRETVMRNFAPVMSDESAPRQREARNGLVEAEVMIKEGRYEQALQALQAAINSDLDNIEAQEKRFRLLLAMGKSEQAMGFADELFELLLRKRQGRKLQELLQDLIQHCPDYRPGSGTLALGLAEQLHGLRQDKLAMKMLMNMHKRFPDFSELPKAYFLAARILSERLKDDVQAIKLLEFLEARYPGAPQAEEIRQYLTVLRKLTGAPG